MNPHHSTKVLLVGASIGGLINATINGVKAWYKLKDHAPMPLTQNQIAGGEPSILADAIPTALGLAIFLTAISFFTLKMPGKPPYFPKVLLLSIKHVFLVLGVLVTGGVLLQRYTEPIILAPAAAAIVVALTTGATAATIDYLTKSTLLQQASNNTDTKG